MLQRFGKIVTYFTLVLLLLLGTTSREFIHLFAGHTDTQEHIYCSSDARPYDQKNPVMEQTHHHCSFLSFDFSLFLLAEIGFAFLPDTVHTLFPVPSSEEARKSVHPYHLLRGPPAASLA